LGDVELPRRGAETGERGDRREGLEVDQLEAQGRGCPAGFSCWLDAQAPRTETTAASPSTMVPLRMTRLGDDKRMLLEQTPAS
jgi:hypothetical protein